MKKDAVAGRFRPSDGFEGAFRHLAWHRNTVRRT